ncbi:hypothetical protein yc1106_04640 [Curvularia clavata]|uniref:Uncharacterized protein n=1 Tax=Curvularia clavata TaxID=95742 RepID=A0A9Q8Z6P6_CURCL|nr:hypothetical protein yc1106_04640 [Curvularia clavata]
MSSYNHQHMSLTEPFTFVSAEETASNSGGFQSPHLPHHSMKRDVSKTLLHTRSYFGKRQKNSHPEPETSVECLDPSIAPRDYMSRSWSNLDSPHPLLPTPLPSPALEETGHSLEHAQKSLQVGELVTKLNFKLRRLFGSRRGSAEDGDIPLTFPHRRGSIASLNLRGLTENPNLESNPEYLMWNGSCQLPNVSEFFDANGEAGPSNFYHTADWSAFQKSFQAQGSLSTQTHLNNHAASHGDADLERFDFFRGYVTHDSEYEARKRKDSFFGFDFLKSRRSSKVDKGKGRMVEDETAMAQQEEATALLPTVKASVGVTISSLAELGVLPRVSMETMPPLSPTEPEDIPQAEFSSLESSTPSWHHGSASSTPPDAETAEVQISTVRQAALCHVVPAADSAAAHASPASSVSSVHGVSVAAPTASKKDAASMLDTPCMPTAASSPSNPAQHSNISPLDPTTPATPCILPTVDSPSSRPLLSPLTTMQTLNLGPPQHTVDITQACHSNGTAESARAHSNSVGLKKSLDEKCWWDGEGEEEEERNETVKVDIVAST